MANITIHNHGTVNIYEGVDHNTVNEAKDELLHKMYFARYKQTLGGYEGWLKLLDMYYCEQYEEMREFIKGCQGKGGKTRHDCLVCLNTIIKGGTN
jgi:hypothetical protein